MASAEIIAKALGGRKAGGSWMARCSVLDDLEPIPRLHYAHRVIWRWWT